MVGNVSGVATSWALQNSIGGAATGVVATKVPRSDGKPGDVQQVVYDGTGSGVRLFIQNTDTTKWATGDVLYAEVEFETEPDVVGDYNFTVDLGFWNGLGGTNSLRKASENGALPFIDVFPRSGVMRTPFKALPAGVGRLQLYNNFPKGTTRILSANIRKVD
jgi:hypothetical protein